MEPRPPAMVRLPDAELSKNHKLASNYTKLMWKREVVIKRDLNRKIMLKWAAIHALPTDELRREALVVDPFIPTFKIPRVTPPLAGFQGPEAQQAEEDERVAAGAEAGKKIGTTGKPVGPSRSGPGGRGKGGGRKTLDMAALLGLEEVKEAPLSSKPDSKRR